MRQPVFAMPVVFIALAGCVATSPGCEETDPNKAKVTVSGRAFTLELALTDEQRFRGLSDRTSILENGGMLFVFPDSRVAVHEFVMRDCPIPIDIIFLDRAGRVTASHAMKPDEPRSEAEKTNSPPAPNAPEWAWVNPAYEARLTRYSSRFPSQFAIELRGGTLETLKVRPGDKVEFDLVGLRKRAK